MRTDEPDATWFAELEADDLSGGVFVRDYVQLQFNPPPTPNVYTPIVVTNVAGVFARPHAEFANALIDQINKYVEDVRVIPNEKVEILFRDASKIAFSLRQVDCEGPEAFTLFSRKGGVWAW